MTRALSSLCLLLTFLWGGSAAFAKDKIAILGLEVVSGSGGIDADSTRVARELTDGLRTRPKAGQGPFAFAPGSEKELIDEKLMNSCDLEKEDCMTPIAKNLGAGYLLFGKIEKKSLGAQTGYQISLKLLKVPANAGSGTIINRWTEFIPMADTQGEKLANWARRGYKRITNDSSDGKLVVKTNIDRGTILLDGKESGNIVNKRGEVPNLPDGRYTLVIEAQGFQRWESDEQITIRGGETTTKDAMLVEMKTQTPKECDPRVATCEGTVSDVGKGGSGWRTTAYIAGGTTIVLAGGFAYTWKELSKTGGGFPSYGAKCIQGQPQPSQCSSGNGYRTASYVTGIGMGVAGTIAIVAIYKGFVAKKESAAANSSVGVPSRKKSRLAVTPVVGPEGAGATLRFDW